MRLTARGALAAARRRRRLAALLAVALAAAAMLPDLTTLGRDPAPRPLAQFLWGLAGEESGWDYYARNPSSEAFGRYQVMPANWPAWADRYIGDRRADQSPLAQERVVRGKVADLYRWLGSWRQVAYWWLTGDTATNPAHWSATARRYVRNVMSLMARAPRGGGGLPPGPGRGGLPVAPGDWRLVARDSAISAGRGSGQRRLGALRDDTVVLVRRSAWGPTGHVLWLRVETASGRAGWLKMLATLPARRPADARRWRDGDGGGGGRGDRRPDPRQRARPRPR